MLYSIWKWCIISLHPLVHQIKCNQVRLTAIEDINCNPKALTWAGVNNSIDLSKKFLYMKFCRETCCPNPVWLKFRNSNIFWTPLNWFGINVFIGSSFMPSIMIGAVACPGCNIEVLGWCPCLSCTHLYPNF